MAAILPLAALAVIAAGRTVSHAGPPARRPAPVAVPSGTAGFQPAWAQAPAPAARPAYTWTRTAGPAVLVHAIVRAPWGALYAGTSDGVETSADEGASWRSLGHGFPAGIEAWGVAPLAASGGDAVLATCEDGYVYRLPRAGVHWTRGARRIGAYATAIYVLPGGVALAGSDRGIYRSTDGGRSWARALSLPGGAVAAFARVPADGAVYAGLAGLPDALRVSADGGRSWRVPGGASPPPSVEALLVGMPGRVYAGVMGAQQPIWSGGAGGFAPLGGLPPDVHGMSLATTGGADGRLVVGSMGTGAYMAAYTSTPARGDRSYGPWVRLGRGPGDSVVTALLALPGARPALLAGTGEGIYRLRLP